MTTLPNTKLIQLTQGLSAIVDEDDFERISSIKWQAAKQAGIFYAHKTITRIRGKETCIRMHREIIGAKKGEIVDHINGDGLDNRKINLRVCTNQQNAMNRERKKTGYLSIYKGVSPQGNKWRAQITKDKKTIRIGSFNTEVEAAEAYNKTAALLFGEYARPNKIIIGKEQTK